MPLLLQFFYILYLLYFVLSLC